MKRIIVPTDFSDIANYGLQMALRLANQYDNAEIFLINAITPPDSFGFSSTGESNLNLEEGLIYVAALRRANEKKLKDIAKTYRSEGVKINPIILIDYLQEGLERFIDENHIDLVIMGTSRESTFEEYFIGNHTEQVMRVAKCPVIAVKSPVSDFSVQDILLTVDLNEPIGQCVRHVKRFANYFDACIHLLYISGDKNNIVAKQNDLEHIALESNLTNYTINVVKDRNKEAAIIRFARENRMDMIASITHGRRGLAHLIMGSIAEDLVKDTDIPVMSLNLRTAA